MVKRLLLWIALGVGVVGVAAAALGWNRLAADGRTPDTGSGYQAVLLTNNQVYYGRLRGLGTPFPVLTEVYYVQAGIDTETKETKSILLKRGKEWHAPDRMVINADHILLVEPVTAGSKVAELIAASK
jgi:hypothetical protein